MNTRHLTEADLRGKRWRGWIRESTERQAAKETTPERQRKDILRAVEELGLVASEPLWYERTGTGEAEGMPELARALADAGQYDVLVVFTTSRFARNRVEAGLMKRRFRDAGIVIYFVAERMISGARSSSLLEGVREVIDQEENETKRMWVAGGIRERQLAGYWHGRVPYGYRMHMADRPDGSRGPDGTLEVVPTEAAIVRDIFARVAARQSVSAITRHLNQTTGRRWNRDTVRRIPANPVYLGQLERYRGRIEHYYPDTDPQDGHQVIAGRWAAIIDQATFDAAQVTRQGWGAHRTRRSAYPLSGLLRCAECGGRLTGSFSDPRHRYYRCETRALVGTCTLPYVRAEKVEGAFAEWFGAYELPADWRMALARLEQRAGDADVTRERERLEGRLARLREVYLWGEMTPDAYRAATREVHEQLANLAPTTISGVGTIAEALGDLRTYWPRGTADYQAEVAHLILREGTVGSDAVEWTPHPELRPLLELCTRDARRLLSVSGLHCSVRWAA